MRLSTLVWLGLAPALAAGQIQALEKIADLTESAVKMGLGLFMNETQIEKMSTAHEVLPHKYAGTSARRQMRRAGAGERAVERVADVYVMVAADLTDSNWEAVLKTGTTNPRAAPLDPVRREAIGSACAYTHSPAAPS